MSIKKIIILASTTGALLLGASAYAQTSTPSDTSAASPHAARVANRALAKKVRQAITHAKPTIPTEGLAVLAKSGTVTLVGEVETQDQVDEAGKVAAAVSGVVTLKNVLGLSERGM